MDDATASDNCGEVTIEVSSETTAGDAAGNYTIVRTFTATRRWKQLSSQTITARTPQRRRVTFVPTTRLSAPMMPMDDATAATRGEVTIEVSGETTAGDPGQRRTLRTFTVPARCRTAARLPRPSRSPDTTAPSSPSSLRLHG